MVVLYRIYGETNIQRFCTTARKRCDAELELLMQVPQAKIEGFTEACKGVNSNG